MKSKVLFFFVLIILLIIINLIFLKFKLPTENSIVGTYTSQNGKFSDTLKLFADYSSYHSTFDNVDKIFNYRQGGWGILVPNYLTIHDFSFSESNYPVDVRYYYNFLWKVCIDVGISETYCKEW